MKVKLVLNGEEREIEPCHPGENLAETLRERLGAMSVKIGCDYGGCGVCSVLVDGKLVYSCMTPTWKANGVRIETVEGLRNKDGKAVSSTTRELDPLQETFVKNFAPQCGYCTPAMILAAKSLLRKTSSPTILQVKDALSGVRCRCTGYEPYVQAILEAAAKVDQSNH